MAKLREIVKVFGIVQGVGFRPFIHKLVNNYGFKGWVRNNTAGVIIDVEGEEEDLISFVRDIYDKAPDLAVIENVTVEPADLMNYTNFKIISSESDDKGFVLVSPDVSICPDCYNELINPDDKRYEFPFTNCTNCGPRFTIIEDLPYDRAMTTMKEFVMCGECEDEYHDIDDRRYHAQPNCCPDCGPSMVLLDKNGSIVEGAPIETAAKMLERGAIVAIKGLGGFHLSCNGMDAQVVNELRKRKLRDGKPFAVMCRDIQTIKEYAYVSEDEEKILESFRRPIVLLKKKEGCPVPGEVVPDTEYIGFMLPYTPVHYLIFKHLSLDILVMTSANISDNPIIYKNDDAVLNLNKIADFFLFHNREIRTRCDDSLVRVINKREYFLRRSRGYVPFPVKLDFDFDMILACGAEQKASFALSRDRYVFISQHIGDLKNYETLAHYEDQVENFKRLFKIEPQAVACDLHPDYLSTTYGVEKYDVKKIFVQHHHAHMASCMADNNLDGDVIGVTWDGTGLGSDGTIWGGEILTGGYSRFKRSGSFMTLPMPGGDRAVKELYAMAYSYLIKTYGINIDKYKDILKVTHSKEKELKIIGSMIDKKLNSPETSSCGRLFDGVSCILGLCSTADYEGQGAVRLEAAADISTEDVLDYNIVKSDGLYIYDWRATIDDIVRLVRAKKDISFIASSFHNTMVETAAEMLDRIRIDSGLNRVVLSGGVFQNIYLLNKLVRKLKALEFSVYIHKRVSTNDEGLSLGQLIIAQNGGGNDVPGYSS